MGDKGIDGRGRTPIKKCQSIDVAAQVKEGSTEPSHVQAFDTARDHAGADLGIFAFFEDKVTVGMRNVAANTGQFMSVPVVRTYTVEDYFEGLRPATPVLARNTGWVTEIPRNMSSGCWECRTELEDTTISLGPKYCGDRCSEQRNCARRRSTGKASAGSGGSGAKRGTRRGENWCGHRKPSGRRCRSRTGGDGIRLGLPGVTRPAGQWRSWRSHGCQGYRGLRRPGEHCGPVVGCPRRGKQPADGLGKEGQSTAIIADAGHRAGKS